MAFMYRFRMDLGGWEGAPGVCILHTTTGVADDPADMGNFMNQMRNGWEGVKAYLINNVTAVPNPEVTKHDVQTGKLMAIYSVTPPAAVTGTGVNTTVSRATQAVCRHNTDGITDRGRRLIGRSFIGPLSGNAMDTSGHINAAAQAAFGGMWDGMQDVAGTCRLIVWHRPVDAMDDPNGQGTVGSFGHVQNSNCLITPGVLRSRRD